MLTTTTPKATTTLKDLPRQDFVFPWKLIRRNDGSKEWWRPISNGAWAVVNMDGSWFFTSEPPRSYK
jgi:hypothetical protein